MFTFKKVVLAFFTLAHSAVFAGSMGTVCHGDLTVPCTTPAWNFGAHALYLQPSFAGNGLGYSSYSNYSGRDINGVFNSVDGASNPINNIFPNWGWGFQIEGGYQLGAGKQLNANWYHLGVNRDGILPLGSEFSGSVDGFYASQLQLESTWDAVNVEGSQSINFSEKKLLRLNAGLQFAHIKNHFKNYPMINANSGVVFITNDAISYNGFGPRLGADVEYAALDRLNLYFKAATSLLVGTAKQNITGYTNYSNSVYGFMPFSTGNYNQSTSSVIVPELDAKLGITYDFYIAQHALTVDLGYLWINYLNALVTYTGNGVILPDVGNNSTANFNLNGLYFGVNYRV